MSGRLTQNSYQSTEQRNLDVLLYQTYYLVRPNWLVNEYLSWAIGNRVYDFDQLEVFEYFELHSEFVEQIKDGEYKRVTNPNLLLRK